MIKLKNRIIILFVIFSLGLILLTSVVSNVLIKNNFNNYIKKSIDEKKSVILTKITSAYNNGSWDINYIDIVGLEALNDGFVLTVTDNHGKNIWNAHTKYNSMCENMLTEMFNNTCKVDPYATDEYVMYDYALIQDNNIIGNLSIGYSGPVYYNNSELMFFKALNTTLFIVTIAAIIFSIIIGIIASSNISRPILNMVSSTKNIVNGHYKKEIESHTNIKELNEMNNSLNELCDALQKDENLRKNLTKDISHELRTPLTTITLQLDALIDGIWEPTHERLSGIRNEMMRLTRLVQSLEELSKYDRSNLDLHKENIEISALIKTQITNFEKQFLDKNIEVIYNLTDLILFADKDKLTQCIINLISNSIKYSDHNSKIFICCYSDNYYGYISIKDTGIGMEQEHLKNIFKRFYRIDTSRARKTGGSGLGLTISKAIAEAHGGTITVTSIINEGSEFIIKIPL